MSFRTKALKIGLPLLLIAISAVVMRFLILNKPSPRKIMKQELGALVETMTAETRSHQVRIFANGTVQAAKEVAITPQVSGQVVHSAPNFVAGGFFRKGDLLFSIEETDFTLALEQAKAALAKAEVELLTIESRALIARKEWRELNPDPRKEANPLVLLEPQVRNARAGLDSARAAVKQAELNLDRTRIYAPFNCLVRSEQIDVGQYIRQGNPVAAVAVTDSAEIIVPLPLAELEWLTVPRQGSGIQGAKATVLLKSGGNTAQWEGRITRSLGEADPKSRMVGVVVEVADPYSFRQQGKSMPDLAFGTFVEVVLHGATLNNVITLPNKAIRPNGTVWIKDQDNFLRIREISLVRREKDAVVINSGIRSGEEIVLTALTAAADGMKLRVKEQEAFR